MLITPFIISTECYRLLRHLSRCLSVHIMQRLLSVIFIFFDGGYCEYILSKEKGVGKQLVGWYRVLAGLLLLSHFSCVRLCATP